VSARAGWLATTALATLVVGGCASFAPPAAGGAGGYTVYVASESADLVTRLHFDGRALAVEREQAVGSFATELDAPHGLAVSPDGRFYYVTLAHGRPYGWLWKLDATGDRVIDRTSLGHFPASIDLTPDGVHAFVANFNLHGDHVPSSISKIHLPTMAEVARTETCGMPHGSRVNARGTRHYSVCMMDQLVVEIDVPTGQVARRFSVAPGREGAVPLRGAVGHHAPPGAEACSPTWVTASPDGERLYVACNRSNEILEVEVAGWRLGRRLATGETPYNVEVTPDDRLLLVTLRNRTAAATEIFDLATGTSLARVPSTTVLPHGIALSADARFAFVSVEGVGREPGRVDVIDLGTLRRVATAEVGQQATGIAVVR
jgi:DNA-binding beta-propeller fold protein YncE